MAVRTKYHVAPAVAGWQQHNTTFPQGRGWILKRTNEGRGVGRPSFRFSALPLLEALYSPHCSSLSSPLPLSAFPASLALPCPVLPWLALQQPTQPISLNDRTVALPQIATTLTRTAPHQLAATPAHEPAWPTALRRHPRLMLHRSRSITPPNHTTLPYLLPSQACDLTPDPSIKPDPPLPTDSDTRTLPYHTLLTPPWSGSVPGCALPCAYRSRKTRNVGVI